MSEFWEWWGSVPGWMKLIYAMIVIFAIRGILA